MTQRNISTPVTSSPAPVVTQETLEQKCTKTPEAIGTDQCLEYWTLNKPIEMKSSIRNYCSLPQNRNKELCKQFCIDNEIDDLCTFKHLKNDRDRYLAVPRSDPNAELFIQWSKSNEDGQKWNFFNGYLYSKLGKFISKKSDNYVNFSEDPEKVIKFTYDPEKKTFSFDGKVLSTKFDNGVYGQHIVSFEDTGEYNAVQRWTMV